ncbi:MAG TPA: hypothetical protein VLT36_12380, partial [Candidatus Dormibacteraeota bacterium]|nr:hypothetical protein [Candidatus Dormibacteraeota bacterium]
MKHYADYLRNGWAAGVFWLVVAALPFAARADGPYALSSTLSTSFASVPHNPALNPLPLTVTAWIKQSQSTNNTPLVTKY